MVSYSTDTAVVWKLVRFTWHVHSTPDDDIELRGIFNFKYFTVKVPYYVWLLMLSTIIIYKYMFTAQSQTNLSVWQNVYLPKWQMIYQMA